MNSLVAKVGRDGLPADFANGDITNQLRLKIEATKIRREIDLAAWRHVLEHELKQLDMVALHVPIEGRFLAFGKRRRIDDRQVERRLPAARVIPQKLPCVVANEFMGR